MPEALSRLDPYRPLTLVSGPVGAITEPLYLGDPTWNVGRRTLTGSPSAVAESLREYVAMGVDQIQVRFRSRDLAELTDQIGAFGEVVGSVL